MKRLAGILLVALALLSAPCPAEEVQIEEVVLEPSNASPTGSVVTITGPNSNSFISASAQAGRYRVQLDDVELSEAVRMFARLSQVNIIASPSFLQGRVTVNLTDVEWRPALDAILSMHNRVIVEAPRGSGVFQIGVRQPSELPADLLFRPPGDASPTNLVSLDLTNASLGQVLREVARQAHVNIRYPPSVSTRGDFTIVFTNADSGQILTHITTLHNVDLRWSSSLNAYTVEYNELVTVLPATDNAEKKGGVIALVALCVVLWTVFSVLLWILFSWLVRRKRKDSDGGL